MKTFLLLHLPTIRSTFWLTALSPFYHERAVGARCLIFHNLSQLILFLFTIFFLIISNSIVLLAHANVSHSLLHCLPLLINTSTLILLEPSQPMTALTRPHLVASGGSWLLF